MSRPYSLRRRLVWLLTGSLATIWLLSALVVYQRAHREADELLDAQLTQVADTLLAIVSAGEVKHFAKELQHHSRHTPVPIAFEVWYGKHGQMRRLVTSMGHDGFDPGIVPGFNEREFQGVRWRFYAVQDADGKYRVVVGQAHGAREDLAREIGQSLLIPAALALPLMALAVWWGIGRNLRPVETVAHQVGALDAQALLPLDESPALPEEIAPLRTALNALIRRVNEAFENERRFTADAAHELRTPLAALKVQAQVASRAQTADSQQHALAQVIAGVDRMTHLVEQLLTLARVDPSTQGAAPPPLDPVEIVTAVCEELLPQAHRQRQILVVDAVAGCRIAITAAWLQVAVRNLLDNAVHYAGEGARIEVHLAPDRTDCVITVADNGPGVAPGLRSQLSARFVRGEVEAEGCGLGLSIVARIATLSHARLELGEGLSRVDGGRGFSATLRFNAVQHIGTVG
ncbi:ATP-binding protein [Thiobacillus sp.]